MGQYIDRRDAEALLNALMTGAALRGFRCRTDYSLELSRTEPRSFHGLALPRDTALCIGGNWWFGGQKEWHTKLRRLEYDGITDSIEPVYAYILASMYWSQSPDPPVVDKILIDKDEIVLSFRGGRPVHIWNDAGSRFAWIVYRVTEDGGYDRLWHLYCQSGTFVVHMPGVGTQALRMSR